MFSISDWTFDKTMIVRGWKCLRNNVRQLHTHHPFELSAWEKHVLIDPSNLTIP